MRLTLVILLAVLALATDALGAPPSGAVTVRRVKPVRRDITRRVVAPAVIDPLTWVELSSPVTGTVAAVLAQVGMPVKRGQVLARIAILDANGRTKGTANVVAPFDGEVTACSARVGAYAAPSGPPLFTLMDLSVLLASIDIPEAQIVSVQPGQKVIIMLHALPDHSYYAAVTRKSRVIDKTTRTARVEATVLNPDRRLMVGMSGRAVIEVESHQNVLVVPRAAVLRQDGTWVFRADGIRARRVAVTLGIEEGDAVEVLEGVGTGDVLLISDAPLRDGASIQ